MKCNKRCKQCDQLKPLSEFYINDTYADGYTGKCKQCILAYQKKYQENNAEKLKKKYRDYYRNNKARISEQAKARYEKNRAAILAKAEKYRDTHRKELRQYFRQRYRRNKSKILAAQKEYSKKHREEKAQYLRGYYRANKSHLLAQARERQRKQVANDPVYKLKRQVRLLIWRSFGRKGCVKPERAEKILGCSLDEFTVYLKQTWFDRYGTEWVGQPCHIDHIIPLATATTVNDTKRLCHYTNLRLLTPEDNLTKSIEDRKLVVKENDE